MKAAREGSPGFGSLVLPRRRSVLRLPLCFSVLGESQGRHSAKVGKSKVESRKVGNSEIQIVEARCRKLQSGYSRKVGKVGKVGKLP